MDNKRGQGLSVNAIILIVLGLVVLIVMILGFTLGWGNLKSIISPSSNVGDVVQSCQSACVVGGSFDFCLSKKELRAEGVILKDVTCNYLFKNQTRYGIAKCDAIPCGDVILVSAVSDADLQNRCTGNAGKTVQALINNVLVSKDCQI
ncbi:MAG: hypothetical protein AABX93_00250 [Nanoarchaeota archaeon]